MDGLMRGGATAGWRKRRVNDGMRAWSERRLSGEEFTGRLCVGLSALGLLAIGYLGLRPRLVCSGPSALSAED